MTTSPLTIEYASMQPFRPNRALGRFVRIIVLCAIAFALFDLTIKWQAWGTMTKVPGSTLFERVIVIYVYRSHALYTAPLTCRAVMLGVTAIVLVNRRSFRWWDFTLILFAWILLAGGYYAPINIQFWIEDMCFPPLTPPSAASPSLED